jgi:general L-amino acid transport system permease protein
MMLETWRPKPSISSPTLDTGYLGWFRANLFSTPGNALLTLLSIAILIWTLPPLLRWGLIDATWLGDSRGICDSAAKDGGGGACWVFIKVRLEVFLYGFYPLAERWRVNFTFLVLALAILPILAPTLLRETGRQVLLYLAATAGVWFFFGLFPAVFLACYLFVPFVLPRFFQGKPFLELFGNQLVATLVGIGLAIAAGALVYYAVRSGIDAKAAGAVSTTALILALFLLFVGRLAMAGWRWVFLFTVYPVFAFFMLVGDVFGLPLVETHFWGGLFLTLVVAGTGMATALPIGILLALGRRSTLPVIKTLCVAFIEFVRGVPLVSVLFMASVMFPLFLPENVTFDKLLRALVGIAFFYAAYMAEVIRGGLQAIPKGQFEAAMALGWPYSKMMALIIIPQTLRLVIPGLANNFLSLLKDTTLVAVIGLLDLLGVAKASMADMEWLGFTKEAYIFAALVFWVFCFAISRYSVYLEKNYHTSQQ